MAPRWRHVAAAGQHLFACHLLGPLDQPMAWCRGQRARRQHGSLPPVTRPGDDHRRGRCAPQVPSGVRHLQHSLAGLTAAGDRSAHGGSLAGCGRPLKASPAVHLDYQVQVHTVATLLPCRPRAGVLCPVVAVPLCYVLLGLSVSINGVKDDPSHPVPLSLVLLCWNIWQQALQTYWAHLAF